MAHIRKHGRSPYWYLRTRAFDGKWREESTGLRWDDDKQTREASRLAEKKTIKERDDWSDQRGHDFRSWVPGYLASRYRLKGPATFRRSEIAWSTVQSFLLSKGLFFPRQIKYFHAEEYLRWRVNRIVHRRKAGHNTARMELKFLSLIMGEAVRREYAESNPFNQMIVPIQIQKQKKALSDDEIKAVRTAIKSEAPWMETVFETMLWTGCRFNEASIDLTRIDFDRNDLTLIDSKRDPNDARRYFSVPLPSALRDRFLSIKETGAAKTVDLTSEKNWRFNRFLKKTVAATSHSLRVTFVTRCHQSGLSERQAKRLVNHSSTAIHDVYSRLNVDDVRLAQARIVIPSAHVQPVAPTTP